MIDLVYHRWCLGSLQQYGGRLSKEKPYSGAPNHTSVEKLLPELLEQIMANMNAGTLQLSMRRLGDHSSNAEWTRFLTCVQQLPTLWISFP